MIEVLFDTGSSDLVILGVDCSACDRNASGTTYNASTSSTSSILDVTAELRYMSGNVTGTVVADTVSIGSYNLTRQLSIVIESPADLVCAAGATATVTLVRLTLTRRQLSSHRLWLVSWVLACPRTPRQASRLPCRL